MLCISYASLLVDLCYVLYAVIAMYVEYLIFKLGNER